MREEGGKLRLALLCGGRSAERKVSLAGAAEVECAFDPLRYAVRRYDPATDLQRLVADAPELDVAFILLHGRYGEDGTVQGLLELLDLPYQGSGVLGSALAMDKNLSKILYRQAGIPTPPWRCLERRDAVAPEILAKELGMPLMVKPATQGSSVGMSKVTRTGDLKAALEEAWRWDQRVIAEAYIQGRELTGGVLGLDDPRPLPLVEIMPGATYTFFDYDAKYRPGATREVCPAEVSEDVTQQAQALAVAAHRALELRGYSRTDMILDEKGGIFVLETNTIPGMTTTSLLPQAAQVAGMSFSQLLDRLVDMALRRHRRKSRKETT
jgi:D-alanine-D-alanine ligase